MIPHIHATILKKFSFDKDTITVGRSNSLNIVFVEIRNKTYYLLILKVEYKYSHNISSGIMNLNRRLSMNEIFNRSFIEMDLLHCMKYYHIPCRKRTNLLCFYDGRHMCICNPTRKQSNCFIAK